MQVIRYDFTAFDDNGTVRRLGIPDLICHGCRSLHRDPFVLSLECIMSMAGIYGIYTHPGKHIEIFRSLSLLYREIAVLLFDVCHEERVMAEDDLHCLLTS